MSVLYHFNFNNAETERFFDDLTLGLLYALNSVMGVENVMTVVNDGLSFHEIEEWQKDMDYPLPNDLRNFYKLIDGLHITWGYKMRKDTLLKVGLLKIDALSDLKPIGYFNANNRTLGIREPKHQDVFTTLDLLSDDEAPKFNTDYKILQLERTRDGSAVCLVYSVFKNSHTIWLLDRSLQWHYITDSFTKYFYMMVKHAGLPQWQMSKISLGMSMWAKQLMYTFALCLRSPPTSVLHCWTVDTNKAKSSYEAAVRDPRALRFAKKTSNQNLGYFHLRPPSVPPNTKMSDIYSISVVSEDRRHGDTIADVEQITTDTANVTDDADVTTGDLEGSENALDLSVSDATVTPTTLNAKIPNAVAN